VVPESTGGQGNDAAAEAASDRSGKLRLQKAWMEALDEEVAESDGEFTSRADLIRHILFKHLEARKARKKR
jgi:Arc/MetJ-type ribon-helix-helix transcriptional regulator